MRVVKNKLKTVRKRVEGKPVFNQGNTVVLMDKEKNIPVAPVPSKELFMEAERLLPSKLYARLHKLRVMSQEEKNTILLGSAAVIYDPTYHPVAAYRLCAIYGATIEEISAFFAVSVESIRDWIADYREFSMMVQKGRDVWDSTHVETSLRKSCIGYTKIINEQKAIKVKDADGNENIEIVNTKREVYVPPKMDAAKFWLTKRSGRWNESKDAVETKSGDSIDYDALSVDELNTLRFLLSKARAAKEQLEEAEVS